MFWTSFDLFEHFWTNFGQISHNFRLGLIDFGHFLALLSAGLGTMNQVPRRLRIVKTPTQPQLNL